MECDPPGPRVVSTATEHTSREAQLDPRSAQAEAFASAGRAPDAELVARALAGSEGAFAELVDRYNDLLTRHAQRMMGRPDDAEDVVQTAWIKAYRRLGQCRDPERFGAWVFRIAANGCKDALKARRKDVVPIDALGELPNPADGPDEEVEQADRRRSIAAALRRLPADQREAFLLKHAEGWSYEDMAERLGVGVSALKMRVHRAREELQKLLLEVPR
ncbi:MAG: sigma-70 family RNA polymerase sigma factor [Gemmatimonadales bacterium]